MNSYGVFNISEIKVTGDNMASLSYVSESEIATIKESIKGKSYFDITYEDVKKRIENISYAESFSLDKRFPYTVVIEIKERIPQYFIESVDGKCALLDQTAFTLDTGDDNEVCSSVYESIGVNSIKVDSTPFQNFKKGEQSNYLFVLNFNDVAEVLDEYGYGMNKIKVKDGVCEVFINDKQSFVFSFNQELRTQLSRFVIVIDQIKSKSVKFSLVDLRYERPVIRGE